MREKKERPKKRYTAIAKTGYDLALKKNICVKYRFNDINNFLKFMQTKHQPLWINIFYNTGAEKGKLAYTYGRIQGLTLANL